MLRRHHGSIHARLSARDLCPFTNATVPTPFQFQTTPLANEDYNAWAALNIAGSCPLSMVVVHDVQFDQEREFRALTLAAHLKL